MSGHPQDAGFRRDDDRMTFDTFTIIVCAYLVASVMSFALYGRDKRRAVRGRWRVRESTLHLVDLLGGFMGGLVARQFFRHKRHKVSFQVMFWLTVLLHVGAWVAYLTMWR